MLTRKKLWQASVIILAVILVVSLVRKQDSNIEIADADSFTIQTWHTSNGAKVMFVPAPQLPMLDVRVVFDAGSARDGHQPGVANLTASMLNEGAGEWDTNTLAERFENIGARYGVSVEQDYVAVSLRSLVDDALLNQALETFKVILTSPNFVESEYQRIQKNTLLAIKSKEQYPGSVASELFARALYGEHPYASPGIGVEDSVKKITTADLRNFYQQYYVSKNALIAIVGQLDRKQAESIAESLSAGLKEGEVASALPEVKPLDKAQQIHQQHPSSQTHILVGQPVLKRGDKDYFSLYVGNHILGGSGFGSRIMEQIREKRGLAYSAYSYFVPAKQAGPFTMGLQTSNHQAEEALKLLNEVLANFIQDGPTKKELEHAKKNITGGFALRIDSNKDILAYISMIGFYGLPLDYLQTFNSNIEAVSQQDIQDAFKRRVNRDKLVTVTVGNQQAASEMTGKTAE